MATKTGITPADLKAGYLWGVDLTHPVTLQTFADSVIESKIRAAEDFYERDLSTFWGVKTVITKPQAGESYDAQDDGYEYRAEDMPLGIGQWHPIKMRYVPIVTVIKAEFNFPASPPNTPSILQLPLTWITVDKFPGRLRVTPVYGTALSAISGMAPLYLGYRTMPDAFQIDYTAGIDLALLSSTYSDLRTSVMQHAAMLVLKAMLAGLAQKGTSQSRSIAGVSHSFSGGPEMWRALIEEWDKEGQRFRSAWKDEMYGPRLTFIG
ncbi:MAG: hypothetical protein WC551_10080 [Patescibacteria group bacterium]